MPLAITGSLLMLLASLSVQSAVLQSRHAQGDREALARREDAAHSAAQQLLGSLNQRHRCLLRLPLEAWSTQGLACATAGELALLQRQPDAMGWSLLSWQPGESGAELQIVLRPEEGLPARRAAFAVALHPDPPRIAGVRWLGWRGVTP